MKLLAILITMFMLALPGPAAAQPQPAGLVTLTPGQAINIRIDAAGAVTLDSRGAATLSEFDMATVRRFSDPKYNAAASGPTGIAINARENGLPEPAPVTPDTVRILFAQVEGGAQTMLILENGYDQSLVYRARIQGRADMQATDVCLVMPMRRGYESWPYPIDRIEISAVSFVPWRPGDPVPCA